MLNYTLDLKTTVIATEDTISDCSMKFLGRLVDANRAVSVLKLESEKDIRELMFVAFANDGQF